MEKSADPEEWRGSNAVDVEKRPDPEEWRGRYAVDVEKARIPKNDGRARREDEADMNKSLGDCDSLRLLLVDCGRLPLTFIGLLLQLTLLLGVGEDGNFQVAVFGAKLVDEVFLFGRILHLDLVGEAEHGAHTSGLDA